MIDIGWASGGFTIPLIADAVMDFNPVALTQSSFTSAVCWFWYGVTHGAPRASSGHRDRGSAVCFSGLGAFFSFTFWCCQNSEHWLTLSRTELMKWGILIWIISCTVIMFHNEDSLNSFRGPNIDIFFTYLPLTAGGGVNTKHPLDTKKKKKGQSKNSISLCAAINKEKPLIKTTKVHLTGTVINIKFKKPHSWQQQCENKQISERQWFENLLILLCREFRYFVLVCVF